MATHDISLTVNGTDHDLTVASRTLLIHALRDRLDYTGPNVGCESGKCGACTVHVDGEAVKACTELAVRADGSEVTTVAGVADGDDLHPVQRSLHEAHGLQCGYCTPGVVMTSLDLLDDEPEPDREEIRGALKGNVCRCTGYGRIVDAIEDAAAELHPDGEADGAGASD
jgi:carbon-monoxide dehydrogenase small subunit